MLLFSIQIFFWTTASVVDAAAVNPKGTKTLFANVLSTFSTKGKPVFINGVFENLILADEPFANALWIFETCVLV